MYNNKLLPWCPFKVNEDGEHCYCNGNCCAWFIRDNRLRSTDSDVGECAVKKIAKHIDNIYDLLLNKI